MTFRTLIRRSLRYHWRSHLGVVLGAAIGSAALIGALVVGDSVKGSLRESALHRLGGVSLAMSTGDRFFTEGLYQWAKLWAETQSMMPGLPPLSTNLPKISWKELSSEFVRAPVLQLPGSSWKVDGTGRANHVQLLGVDQTFFQSRSANEPLVQAGGVWINRSLATQLQAKPGDTLLLRLAKPTALSQEVALVSRNEATTTLRLNVAGIAPAEWADFSLQSGPTTPLNAFLNRTELAKVAGLSKRLNLFVAGAPVQSKPAGWLASTGKKLEHVRRKPSLLGNLNFWRGRLSESTPVSISDQLAAMQEIIKRSWRLSDLQTELRIIECAPVRTERFEDPLSISSAPSATPLIETPEKHVCIQMQSSRVFLDPPIATAADKAVTNAQPILTYLATLLRAGTNLTPYLVVTAAGAPWTPAGLHDDEIVVSQWLADDLHVKPGDEIALSYFLPESGAKLEEATNKFRVHSIVPMEMPWADRTLMPDFPGLEKAESTRDWDAGFPLTYRIRQKDEDYWKEFRGTPKAFITLAAGQKMWANRFGNLTAIRFPIPTNSVGTAVDSGVRGQAERDPALASRGAPERTGPAQVSEAAPQDAKAPSPLRPAGALQSAEDYRAALEKKILSTLKPEELGLRFEPVREQALKAAEQSQDFGGLFLGFSFFLIAAALLLMAMLFAFGLEQRAPEIGTLLALGFTPKQVRRFLLGEGVALAFIGGMLGALGGLAYAKAMLHGLTTVWRDAVGATTLSFDVTAQTMIIGLLASVVVSVVTIWLTLRKFVRRAPRELLAGEVEDGNRSLPDGVAQTSESAVSQVSKPASRATPGTLPIWKSAIRQVGKPALRQRGTRPPPPVMLAHFKVGWLALVVAGALVGGMMLVGDTANAGAFFGAGALVLLAGLAFISAWLASLASGSVPLTPSLTPSDGGWASAERVRGDSVTLTSLALRGCARRRKRSLATVAMLACGSFLIVSIGVFRLDANRDAWKRTSGTGGFALIGETTMPVVQDLDSQSGREFFALRDEDLAGVSFVPFRVREGDEASCLNLNRAQKPRLLGVKPGILEGRFTVVKGGGWQSLRSSRREEARTSNAGVDQSLLTSAATNEVTAIGDANSIRWAMHKKVGGAIDYVDERGQPFKVRIVGAVANSILQGQLIIDEAEFVKRFPGESGYRLFLIDAPSNAVSQVSATLSRAMQDVGLELTPAAQRLAQFNAVQNTYLGTFQVLGGLGLLLGSVGLGIVVLRNVLERRGELAVLLAVGFRKPTLQRLLLIENGSLLGLGLAIGVVAAAVAALPALLSPGTQLPWLTLTLTLVAVLLNGAVWTWAAMRVALRGDLLAVLRNE